MVSEIQPDYYAVTQATGEYLQFQADVLGSGFDSLPEGLIAVLSNDNDNPLKYRFTASSVYILDAVVVNDNTMHLDAGSVHRYTTGSNYYVGAILDSNRSIVWQNDSKPLP